MIIILRNLMVALEIVKSNQDINVHKILMDMTHAVYFQQQVDQLVGFQIMILIFKLSLSNAV